MRGRPKAEVKVSKQQLDRLESMIDDKAVSERVRLRCRLVKQSLAGQSNTSIAQQYDVSARTVANWTERFLHSGINSFYDQPRSGRPKIAEPAITLSKEDADKLHMIARRRKTEQQTAFRARIILKSAENLEASQIAEELNTTAPTVRKWQKRFATNGMAALADLPRSGPNRTITDSQVEEVVTLTLESLPENATHWSTRSMAKRCGISGNSVMRIWHAFELKPHLQDKFQLSTDPFFVEKVRDVVGLYMSPPQNAVVLCVDEKSQIQALERSQPVLPLRPRRTERVSHDYYRHGTVSLFAALDIATGNVIGQCNSNHTHKEFLKFLKKIHREVPKELEIHAVLDNYATHKTPEVQAWLKKHPRWQLHFIPTHSSWINQVERWFAKITNERIRRGVFRSVSELVQAIESYIQGNNKNPKPFKWTASTDLILGKIQHLCKELNR